MSCQTASAIPFKTDINEPIIVKHGEHFVDGHSVRITKKWYDNLDDIYVLKTVTVSNNILNK